MYAADRGERCACWKRYDVNDRNKLIGGLAPADSAVEVTRLKQNNLFALAKSYVESRIPASGPGLYLLVSPKVDGKVMSYSERKMFFACSAVGVGVVGRDPGAKAPNPMYDKVFPMLQLSGRSSCTAMYLSLDEAHVAPMLRTTFLMAASLTKSSSRKRYGF